MIVFACITLFIAGFSLGYWSGVKDGQWIERHESGCTRYCLSSDCKKHNGGKLPCPLSVGDGADR